MTRPETKFETDRLILRSWRIDDLDDFARLHGNPVTMRDHGATLDRAGSERKLLGYIEQYQRHGHIRWRVGTKEGEFLGYVGLYPNGDDHPLGRHSDIGWRLLPQAWGKGYATEAARAAMDHAFDHCGLTEILAYTQVENLSSQAVIARLPFHRDPSRDFSIEEELAGLWQGMTWVARAPS